MGFLVALVVTGVGFLIGTISKASKGTRNVIDTNAASVKHWAPYVRPAAQANGIDPGVAMAWLAVESGGNICAVGERTARGPDGAPKEVGLFQLYNPDDFKALKAKATDLRAYCVKPLPGQPDPMRISRNPTSEEIAHHIALGIGLIHKCMSTAAHYLGAAGITWRSTDPDFWRAVKLVHALPVIVSHGFEQVTQHLGHPPATWNEFRSTYAQLNPRARYNPSISHQDGYWRALENAERTGDHYEGSAIV